MECASFRHYTLDTYYCPRSFNVGEFGAKVVEPSLVKCLLILLGCISGLPFWCDGDDGDNGIEGDIISSLPLKLGDTGEDDKDELQDDVLGEFVQEDNSTLVGEAKGELEARSGSIFLDILLSWRIIPCCVSACLRRSTFLWKARPHCWQAKGLKPECLWLCVIRLDDWEKAFPHSLHTYGFSPVKNKS